MSSKQVEIIRREAGKDMGASKFTGTPVGAANWNARIPGCVHPDIINILLLTIYGNES